MYGSGPRVDRGALLGAPGWPRRRQVQGRQRVALQGPLRPATRVDRAPAHVPARTRARAAADPRVRMLHHAATAVELAE